MDVNSGETRVRLSLDPNPLRLAGRRVLIVEDEPLIAIDHADTMSQAGADVVGLCADVPHALAYLDSVSVDVAVIDFVLLDRNSEALQVALERKRVPYVIVTAYPTVLVRRKRSQRILHKPVSPEQLCASVHAACAEADATRA
jgi:DNA-binding response OmpR family regulator